MTNCHLVIVKKHYLEAILGGRKQIESRFSKAKRPYFGHILPGDKLFLKLSSGPVCATASAAAVKKFENLTPEQIIGLKRQYNDHISGSEAYWRSKQDCRFGLLVWLESVRRIEPVRINKRDWRAWVVLTDKENFGLLKTGAIERANK